MTIEWLRGIRQDINFAARMLAKDRRFTAAAVIALGLAIGVNNSVFTLINTALIRDLPFDEPHRLVSISVPNPRGSSSVSYPDFRDWRATATAFEGLAATINSPMNVSVEDRPPERFRGTYVSANTFRLLRSAPMLGRDFLPEDDGPGAPAVVMLGHALWQSLYGGDRAVIGRAVRVNEMPATLIGVMPPGFTYPFVTEVWQPLSLAPALANPKRGVRTVGVIGRLADRSDLARARAELEAIAAQLAREYPDTNKDAARVTVVPMREAYGRFGMSMLMTFMGAVGLVLLIACANLANLLLARSTSRSREIAIRTSLGASRWRIVRQLLIECLLIAALAGVLGTLLSIYGARTIAVGFDVMEVSAPTSPARPFWVDLSMDASIIAFVGMLCVFATLACGLIPALHVSRMDANEILKEGGGAVTGQRVRWWSGTFVVAEIALTLVLLASAGLLWRSFVARYRTDLVIDTSNLMTMRVMLPAQKYGTPTLRQRFFDQLEERLSSSPVVASATIANVPPLDAFGAARELSLDGPAAQPGATRPTVSLIQTGARYFATVQLPVIHGRVFTGSDGLPGQESAIVDQRFATMFFPDGNPVGRRIRLTVPANAPDVPAPWLTIVGVAADLPQFGPPELARPIVYVPRQVSPMQGPAAIVVRGAGGLPGVISVLREEVRAIDPDLPLYAIETVDAAVARNRGGVTLVGTWFSIIAMIALVLASVGLYALTAHGVAQRTQEIGVRMALGAERPQVLWLFMRRAVVQLGIGLSLGTAGALATGRLLQTYLGNVSPRDPVTLLAVVALLIVVAVAASVLPARRATLLDPAKVLRGS